MFYKTSTFTEIIKESVYYARFNCTKLNGTISVLFLCGCFSGGLCYKPRFTKK